MPRSSPNAFLFATLLAISIALSARAETPARHDDDVLGRLVHDARVAQFSGRARWAGSDVDMRVDGTPAAPHDDALATARALWRADRSWDARARRVAADQLLALYNDTWRDAGPALDAAAFGARLSPSSVVAFGDGEFELWYHDDGLFGGHAIRVVGSIADGPQGATIEG
jgi:hypothetical protein